MVVLGDEFEFAAEDAAGGVDLLDGEARALVGVLAEDGLFAGHGGELADPDGLRRGAATGQAKGEARGQDAGAEGEPTQGEQGADGHEGVESG
jgi:hypothetical protein